MLVELIANEADKLNAKQMRCFVELLREKLPDFLRMIIEEIKKNE